MSYRIEGDGSWRHTTIWKDNVLVDYEICTINVCPDGCFAKVDKDSGRLDRVVLLGIHSLIGDGEFSNTKLFFYDEMLRGVQEVVVIIEKGKDTILDIRSVFLPNLVEGEECSEK